MATGDAAYPPDQLVAMQVTSLMMAADERNEPVAQGSIAAGDSNQAVETFSP